MNKRMRAMQGCQIPVTLGMMDVALPYYYDSGIYFSILFLNWVVDHFTSALRQSEARFFDQVNVVLRGLHKLQVLHRDWNHEIGCRTKSIEV